MLTGGILGSIWAVHLFPGAPGVHPLNPGHLHLHQHRVWFLHVTWICSGRREPTWHCDLVHKIWQRNHSLEYVVHHAIDEKKKLVRSGKNGSVENEKCLLISLCGGLTTGIVRFHYWDFLPNFRDHSIPLIPCNCISWSFPVRQQRWQ